MKHVLKYSFTLLILSGLYACNSDVFVDKIKLPFVQTTLNGDGDTLTIRFNTTEWQLTGAYEGDNPYGLSGQYYTLDGTDMGPVPSCLLENKGKIVVKDIQHELAFIRSDDKELQVCTGGNITGQPFPFSLLIGNKKHYGGEQEIHFTQGPGSGYVIDRIEYSLIPESEGTESFEDNYLLYSNSSNEPEVRTYNLNERMNRHIYLSCSTAIHFAQTDDNPPAINLPSADSSQELKPGSDRIEYFQNGNALVEMSVQPPFIRTMTLKPGITNIKRIAEYQVYSTNYTLFLRNAKTGKPHSVLGTLRSKTPTGTIGFILEHQKNSK